MCEICLTVAGTVISGVLVFIVSQLFVEFVIKPKAKLNELKSRILYILFFYANAISNPFVIHRIKVGEDFEEFKNSFYSDASAELRKLGSELSAFRKKEMMPVVENLIGLSNGLWMYDDDPVDRGRENKERSDKIKEMLK